jgi:hypothetical protein
MDFRTIAAMRLVSQQIIGTTDASAPALVKSFAAIQGQEYAQTKWSTGLRLKHLDDKQVEKDLTEGRILRTHLLRPTWHFVAAQDLRWIVKLTAPRTRQASAYMYRQLELDKKIFSKANKVIEKVLIGNKHLTRDEINNEFIKNKIIAEGHRLSYIMFDAEQECLICSGARRGNQFTYALVDERVASAPGITGDEALAELARRYFNSRGPATIKDFATWSGLTIGTSKRALQIVRQEFLQKEVEAQEYIYIERNLPDRKLLDRVDLLPVYDEMIMGYKDRSAYMGIRSKLKPVPSFSFDSAIMHAGQIIGTWRRTIQPKSVDVVYKPFLSFTSKQQKLFDATLKRLGQFVGLPVNCTKEK